MADKKQPTADDIMSATDMKPMVTKAKQDTIYCAIALSSAKEGVILLHNKKKPKLLRKELIETAKDKGLAIDKPSIRFGTAIVPKDDSTTLQLTVNKAPVGGMEAKLKVQIRGSGCTSVVILINEALELESEEDVDTSGATAEPATPPATGSTDAPPPSAPARRRRTGSHSVARIAARARTNPCDASRPTVRMLRGFASGTRRALHRRTLHLARRL